MTDLKEMPDDTDKTHMILRCQCGAEEVTRQIVPKTHKYYSFICQSCREAMEREAESRLKEHLFLNSIPPKYREVKKPLYKNIVDSTLSIVYGEYGTGKTWEAYAILKSLYLSGKVETYKMFTELGLTKYLKSGFRDETFDIKIEECKNCDLLIIDEYAKGTDTEFNMSHVYDILNYRYDWDKKTILICNATTIEELYKLITGAILDRFRECIVHIGGKSKRYKK